MEDHPWFKHYPENMPKSVTYPKVAKYQFLEDAASDFPNNVAISAFKGEDLTYTQLLEMTERYSAGLADLGGQCSPPR